MHRRNPLLIYFSLFSITTLLICGIALFQMSRSGDLHSARSNANPDKKWYRQASAVPGQEIAIIDEAGNNSADESECLEIIEDNTSSRDFEVVIWKPEDPQEKARRLRQEQLADEQRDIDQQIVVRLPQEAPDEILQRHREIVAELDEKFARFRDRIGNHKSGQMESFVPSNDPGNFEVLVDSLIQGNDVMPDFHLLGIMEQHKQAMARHREHVQKHREKIQKMIDQAR